MQRTPLTWAAHAAMLFSFTAFGCGGTVDAAPPGDTAAASSAASSSGAGGGATSSRCETQGGSCVSLDLPSCPEWFVSAYFAGACEDPGNAGQSQCCLPAADTCALATPVDLAGGTLTISGDTTSAVDEHPSLTCDSHHVAFSLNQGQFYFRFEAKPGRSYEFVLTTSFYGFLYVFPSSASCSVAAIEEACSSEGATGMVSGIVNPGASGTSLFVPSTWGEYVFAVDGDTSPGHFEVTVTEH